MRLDTLPAQSRLFGRHQPFPRALKPQLNPESRGEKYVDFTGLNFLEVSGGNFGFFSQLLLRHASAHPLPAHIRAEKPYSRPFFFAQRHDILHPLDRKMWNDMVHREIDCDIACQIRASNCQRMGSIFKSRALFLDKLRRVMIAIRSQEPFKIAAKFAACHRNGLGKANLARSRTCPPSTCLDPLHLETSNPQIG